MLKQTCALVSSQKRKKLTQKEYAYLQKRYRNILTRSIIQLPARPEQPSGERGRLPQSDAQILADRLSKHEYAVLLFAYRAEVPFTNNRLNGICAWAKSNRKSAAVSGSSNTHKLTAAYPATGKA